MKGKKIKRKYISGTQQTLLDNSQSYQNAQNTRDNATQANTAAAGTTASVANNFGPIGQIIGAAVGVSQSAKIKSKGTDKYGVSQEGLDPGLYDKEGNRKSGVSSKSLFNDTVEDTGTGVIKNIKTGDYGKAAATALLGPLGGTVYRALGGKTKAERAYESQIQQSKYLKKQSDLTKNYNADYNVQSDQVKKGMKKINKYGDGKSSIHIKPENKGKFTATKEATGKSTEELTHSKNPITKKRAIFAQNAKKWNHKEEGTKDIVLDKLIKTHSKSYKYIEKNESPEVEKQELKEFKKLKSFESKKRKYGNGARVIETEGREPIFTPKDKNGNRELVYYNPNDPTHEQGGVKAKVVDKKNKFNRGSGMLEVPEGSAIVTAINGKNKKAIEAFKEGDKNKLEKIIKTLPEDKPKKNNKKYKGDKSILQQDPSTLGQEDSTKVLNIDESNNPKIFNNKSNQNLGYGFQSGGNSYSSLNSNTPAVSNTTSTTKSGSNFTNKAGNALNKGATYAPAIYNLAQGLFSKSATANRRLYNPEKYSYQDMSDPSRRAAQEAYNLNKENVAKGSGGNSSIYLSNVQQAANQKYKNLSDINQYEIGRRQDIKNANTELSNNAQMTNLGLNREYDVQDLQNKAAKREYLQTGLTQGSQIAQQEKLNSNLAEADKIRASTLKEANYEYDPESKQSLFKGKDGMLYNDKGDKFTKEGDKYKKLSNGTKAVSKYNFKSPFMFK